jgi:hypothetical protein
MDNFERLNCLLVAQEFWLMGSHLKKGLFAFVCKMYVDGKVGCCSQETVWGRENLLNHLKSEHLDFITF